VATETPASSEPVDENGKPEGPAAQAIEKRKHKNLVYAGLALGAIGIVVAIYLARKNSAAAAAGTSANPLGTTGNVAGGTTDTGSTGSSSGDTTQLGLGLNDLNNQQASFATQLAALTTADSSFHDQVAAQNTANASAQAGLLASIDRLTSELKTTTGGNTGDHTSSGTGSTATGKPAPNPAAVAAGAAFGIPATTAKAATPAKINAGNYPINIGASSAGASNIDVLGAVGSSGLKNVGSSGAPVYALVNTGYGPVWEQGAAVTNAKAGTMLATLKTFASKIVTPAPKAAAAAAKPVVKKA